MSFALATNDSSLGTVVETIHNVLPLSALMLIGGGLCTELHLFGRAPIGDGRFCE